MYVSKFKDGKQNGNYVFYEKRTTSRYEQYSASADGKHFMKEVDTYDEKGRLIQEDNLSDYPAVQADGIVLRADRVVHVYGSDGRLVSMVFYAMGTKCWQHNFVYEE